MRTSTTFPFWLTMRKGLPWSSTTSTFNLWNFPSFNRVGGNKAQAVLQALLPVDLIEN